MELSARIPTRGSCYIFSYTTLGELAAVVGGLCLTLEYGITGGTFVVCCLLFFFCEHILL